MEPEGSILDSWEARDRIGEIAILEMGPLGKPITPEMARNYCRQLVQSSR